VFERNKPDDTFGWGVVLSDETLDNLEANDPISAATIRKHFAYWDDMALIYQGTKTLSSGHGFCGIGRKTLLQILQARAIELGVDLQFETEIAAASSYMLEYDLVVACDGLNSKTRLEFQETFQPDIDVRKCQFIWLGTHQKFDDAFTFIFEKTDKGWLWVHAYQFDDDTATFIVECSQQTFDAYRFGDLTQQETIAICEEVFKEHLDGHSLMTNANHIRGSAWIQFPRVLCEKWHHENLFCLVMRRPLRIFPLDRGQNWRWSPPPPLRIMFMRKRTSQTRLRNTRMRAAWRSCACNQLHETRWNGSKT